MQKRKILVVEDDADIQTLLVTLLTRKGYQVDKTDSGLNALASFSRSIPDLILLDMGMPDMDGLTFLQRRRQFEVTRDIPVIVVSARDPSSDKTKALEAGAASYMTKPFDNAKLVANVERLLAEPGYKSDAGPQVLL